MPDAPGLELIMAEINRSHPGAVLDTSFDREQPALLVSPPSVVDVLTWLRNTSGQEYTFMSSLHGADYFPREPRFAVHYELMNRERHERLRVKAVVPDPEAGGGAGSVATPDGRLSTAAADAAAVSPGVPSGATTDPASSKLDEGSSNLSAPGGEKDNPATGSQGTDSTVAASVGDGSGGTPG
ncbi:MAG: NADH-quinone oxidoreductase subunit C, partial [Solirubrobacterales bacterium]|nr:NADH-quinone oxidoreductase subunit C [Solirubrobacterales bacterium]